MRRPAQRLLFFMKRPNAHGGQGMNLLFGDGHVEFMRMQDALQMIETQKAGKRGRGI